MAMISKNQGRYLGKDKNPFYLPDSDCLPKHNYSTGAGYKASKKKDKYNWIGNRTNRGKPRRCAYAR
jgi:hypothetical protein